MQITLILKNTGLEIIEVVVDNLPEKLLAGLQQNSCKNCSQKNVGTKFNIIGAVTQLGLMSCDKSNWKNSEIRKNPFFCPDKKSVNHWEKYLLAVRKSGSSCGAIIELRASGIPVGLGAPIYSKLDTDISSALMSINAVKGVNIGSGMSSAFLSGEENDEITKGSGKVKFKSNQAGGILGGISSGQDIIASFAVKPTSSILTSRKTIDKKVKIRIYLSKVDMILVLEFEQCLSEKR